MHVEYFRTTLLFNQPKHQVVMAHSTSNGPYQVIVLYAVEAFASFRWRGKPGLQKIEQYKSWYRKYQVSSKANRLPSFTFTPKLTVLNLFSIKISLETYC